MTLARKMIAGTAALILGLLLLAAAALWGSAGINRNLGQAIEQYDSLRTLYEIGVDVSRAREALAADSPNALDTTAAVDRLRAAILKFDELRLSLNDEAVVRCRTLLREVLSDADAHPAETAHLVGRLNGVLGNIAGLARETKRRIGAIDEERNRRMAATMMAMAALSGVVVLAAIAIGVAQYRGVMRPIRNLAEGVRHIAAGRFTERLPVSISGNGDELGKLSEDFNRMAVELDTVYRDLEAKVDAKSRELIRSERLASVGYLAAGVAHEINNPLGIIAGHAELSLRGLERDGPAAVEDAKNTLRVIAEESFRCKEITQKLLSLLRGGAGERREPVNVATAARDVISLTSALPRYRQRGMTLACDKDDDLRVTANAVELKQVLLNLMVNALEAGEENHGKVEVFARRAGAFVEIVVADSGRGMTPEILERVFEPFFTQKRGVAAEGGESSSGTGLGLSITHAIVEAHGGRIRAESAGAGLGSRFVLEWPAA